MIQLIDQIGHNIKLLKEPSKIISLVPSQTELLVDLECEDLLIGITRFCSHPKHLRSTVTIVGGTKDLNLDLICQINPDLIICNKEENNKNDVLFLQNKFPTYTSDVNSLEDATEMIRDISLLVGNVTNGEKIISDINNGINPIHLSNRGSVSYFIWSDPYMVVGGNTFINSMLEKAGFNNAFEKFNSRYPSIQSDNLLIGQSDYIFLSSEPYPFKSKHLLKFQNEYPSTKVILVDGRKFSWYGSCIREFPRYIRELEEQL